MYVPLNGSRTNPILSMNVSHLRLLRSGADHRLSGPARLPHFDESSAYGITIASIYNLKLTITRHTMINVRETLSSLSVNTNPMVCNEPPSKSGDPLRQLVVTLLVRT